MKLNKKSDWKQVKVEGILDAGDFEGFAGLEVLESYDDSFIKSETKNTIGGELDGEIYDIRKRKFTGDTSDEEEEEEKPEPIPEKKEKKSKSKKTKKQKTDEPSYPGRFVLLKPPESDEDSEYLSKTKQWQSLGVASDEILKAIADKNFETPTKVQSSTILQAIMGKCDMLIAADTGSGKTLCYGIPIVQSIQKLMNESELTDDDVKPLYSLILAPTRELAQQILNHLKDIAKYTDIKIVAVIGGLSSEKQERILASQPEIVVATPGRLWELIQDGNDHLKKVDSVKYFVVDEADRMMEKGHFEELQHVLKLITSNESDKNKRQNFVLSATLTMVHELPEHLLANKKKKKAHKMTPQEKTNNFASIFGMTNPKVVDLSENRGTAEKLMESRILCELQEKDFYLYYLLLMYPGRTIVFCNSIECVKRLTSVLSQLQVSLVSLHGNMEQKQRMRNLEKFQENPKAILISTEVAARGLDIPNVMHVIHYQVPRTCENYVHRSGRTARANKEGIAILIMEPNEVKYYVKINKTLGRNEDLPIFPTDSKIMQVVKNRVRLAREVEDMDLQNRRYTDEVNWQKKAADDIGIMLEDRDDSDNESSRPKIMKSLKMTLKSKKSQLQKLLAQPITPSGISLKYPISGGNINQLLSVSNGSSALQTIGDVVKKNQSNRKYKMKLYK